MSSSFFTLLAMVIAIVLSFASPSVARLEESQYQVLFTEWLVNYDKQYESTEFFPRYDVWKTNLDVIMDHNAAAPASGATFTLGMNQFGDLTDQEFRKAMTGFVLPPNADETYEATVDYALAEKNTTTINCASKLKDGPSIDWRTQGAVTPVKNQGSCGSCFTFSATGAIEGATAIAGNGLTSLSEQQALDCSRRYGGSGCQGGFMNGVFQWVISNKGICSAAEVPYLGRETYRCNTRCNKVATIKRFVSVPRKNEEALLAAVATVPVSIAIEASGSKFRFYKSGVFQATSCKRNLDHAMLVVGAGTDENDVDFWILKNSYSTSWGEDGFMRIERNKDACGLSQQPSYVVV